MEKVYIQIDDERIEATEASLLELVATQAAMKSEADTRRTEMDKAAVDKAALLAKLGITAEEAKLLLGGN